MDWIAALATKPAAQALAVNARTRDRSGEGEPAGRRRHGALWPPARRHWATERRSRTA